MLERIVHQDNSTFWYIFNFTNMFVYFVLFKFLVDYSEKKRTSNKMNYISLFLLSLIAFFVFFRNGFMYMIFCIIFYKISYEVGIFKSIIHNILYWGIIYNFLENFMENIIEIINYEGIYKEIKTVDIVISYTEHLVIKIIISIIIYLIYIYIKKCIKLKKLFTLSVFIPIITNILTLLTLFRYKAFTDNLNSELVLITFMIIISNIAFYIILKTIIESQNIKHENKILTDNILKEYNYYLKMNKEQEKVKEIYHDIKNHMICMKDMCKNNEIENAKNYIGNIEVGLKNYTNYNQNFNTGNMIVDSILNNKKILCEEKSIGFDVDVDFSKNDYMQMTDICIIFSNIIDNAIEACIKIQTDDLNKKIRIESKYIENFCVIVIENTKTNQVKHKNNNLITTKKDKFIHGIGLKNVKNVVKKYLGEVVIEHSEEKFILKIMIPLNEDFKNKEEMIC
ncbi:sensor histidine kinase [Romboutsia lituseburensis]|uniref:sensor histidine kinase n=1 Tax=Romboutsia lituseburensis TaxID=1537 RepID=UPI00215A60E3|nr:sensor histidine kinase [Romboutsia lituseburensis]MCR8745639.1 GHKL domain-containing protein [Romboutsia lituseburensis]